MTDAELSALEAAANPATVLEMIEELQQARAERDWLAQLAANNIPTINDFVRATQGWLDAAKEATCHTKFSIYTALEERHLTSNSSSILPKEATCQKN